MNQLTIRQRLLLLTLVPSALMSIVLVIFFTLSSLRTLEANLADHGAAIVRYLAPISEYGIISGQLDSLHTLVQATLQDPAVKAAIIVNRKGRTVAVSGKVSLASEHLRSLPLKPGLVTETDNWIAFGAPVVRSTSAADSLFDPLASDVGQPSEVIGAVFIEFDKNEFSRIQTGLIQRGIAIALVGLILLASVAVTIAKHAAQPVRRLVGAVNAMGSGQFDTRVAATSSGELGILERGFNDMAEHIANVHASMQVRIETATAQLAFQARHDALTGLINRREFEQRLESAVLSVQSGGEEFTVLFIDLDRFKVVNDACGHLAGDELLRQIARLFQGRLRDQDSLARVGGDEFCILLANCTGTHARQVAEDICALAAAFRFIWQDKVFAIGTSIGLTQVSPRVRNMNEVLAAGDAACYQAKNNGRNQVVEQSPNPAPERRQDNSLWPKRITEAMAAGDIHVDVTPLRALQATLATPHFVEISARLNSPGQASVSHSSLIDTAERYDLMPQLDRYFLGQALEAQTKAAQHGQEFLCLIPVSAQSLMRPDYINTLAERLSAAKIQGKNLIFLLNETETTRHATPAVEFCRAARLSGCRIALDDFGGALSSFNHLRAIAPDFVKLSRSLTRNLTGNRASTALLRAIQEISSDQGIFTIADGVEQREAVDNLKEIGVSYAQGKAIAALEPLEVWLEGAVMRLLPKKQHDD